MKGEANVNVLPAGVYYVVRRWLLRQLGCQTYVENATCNYVRVRNMSSNMRSIRL